jgi:tripartite-type tricarboxylate transporter receptor subunit TctC
MPDVRKRTLAANRWATNVTRRKAAGWLFTLLAIAPAPIPLRQAYAKPYPERPIKIIVPFPPAGPTDIVARLIAQSLASRLGQSVIVENLVGAGGRIGAKAAASAPADGHTLLLGGTNINAMLGALYKNLGFDPTDSFSPVAAVCIDSMALAISPGVPADTFQQFVDYAKGHPGKLKYGAPSGIYPHFAGEFFKIKTGTDILFVPYKGGTAAITDVIGGHIDMVFNPKSSLLEHFKAGKLKALAVTSESRWPELPDTPTMVEVGVTGFPKEIWFGLLAPAGTPAAIVDQLNTAVNEGLKSAEMGAGLAKLGIEARIGTAQDFADALSEQVRLWKTVVDATGIKVD